MDTKGLSDYFYDFFEETKEDRDSYFIQEIKTDPLFETYYTVYYYRLKDGTKFSGRFGISKSNFREYKLNRILNETRNPY